jgi:AraC-like DNA-binding protein
MAVTKNLYQPFEIEYKEVNECPIVGHKHNFFELVYIIDGEGIQCVNENLFEYNKGQLFLLMPQDCHSFKVHSITKFLFIRFNDIYLKKQDKNWIQQLEFIFQNTNSLPGCILRNQGDKILVKTLIEAIVREHINKQPYHRELIEQLVNTLITIVARNSFMHVPEKLTQHVESKSPLHIIHYIHQHIYTPSRLRIEQIAEHFNLSVNYVSEYFKKHVGESLQQYIMNYKLRLVETRLQYSSMRMNEIAYELNFTDESHLNRTFKKYKGLSPSEFRKATNKGLITHA